MFRKTGIYTFLFTIFWCSLSAQIVINEVSPGNATVLIDEDGEYKDWIELYNAGSSAVNLIGYGITDDAWILNKWQFPNIMIDPNDHITFFASGKDRKTFSDHWETVIYANDTWRYMVPSSEPSSNWRISPAYNDTLWQQGPGGIGYENSPFPFGDTLIKSLTAPNVMSVYLRREFNIVDTALIAGAVLHMDYDDGFVAYINGVEIARANLGENGTPTPFNQLAFQPGHEAAMYAGGMPEIFLFDKSMIIPGNNVLAIQAHNVGPGSSDLSAHAFLSLAIKDASNNYGVVPSWFNVGIARMHTNFKLSQAGEVLALSDATGSILDQKVIDYIQIDNSQGRLPDGNTNWVYFGDPTPDFTNNGSVGMIGYVSDPVFSINAGFYTGTQVLSISNAISNATTRYTTNGSIPVATSPLYTTPIVINSTTVIRARSYHDTLLPSNIVTNTYMINDSTSATLPVISISTNPELLFDPITGIYVLGPNADSSSVPYFGANFWQRWEIQAHFEYFDKQRIQGFEQDAGLKIFGNWSRKEMHGPINLMNPGRHYEPVLPAHYCPE